MTQKQTYATIGVLGLAVLLTMALVGVLVKSSPNTLILDAGAALVIITASAVAIERFLELIWTFIGQLRGLGSWWPFSRFTNQVLQMEHDLDETLLPVYERINELLKETADGAKWTETQIKAASNHLSNLKGQMQSLQQLAPGNQRVELIAGTALHGLGYFENLLPELQASTATANQAVAGIVDFVATFKDNPARRLISIFVGMMLGVIVSGLLQLDLFVAAGGATIEVPGFALGVVLTGIVIGLGSNPTHEVIRYIQEAKKDRKLNNAPMPTTTIIPAGFGTSGAVEAAEISTLAPETSTESDRSVLRSRLRQLQAQPAFIKTLSLRRR